MDDFGIQHALRDLDERTPQFLREEMFAHGDLTTRVRALEVLREGVEPRRQSFRVLREIIRLVPE